LALVNLGIGRAVARYLQRDTVGGGIEMKRNLHLASPDEIRQDIDNLLLNGVLLTIEDTGCGMPPGAPREPLRRVVHNEIREGTGSGLWVVNSIVS